MKWFKKNNLDEMQELQLLKLESRGFWIGFFGLCLAMAVQAFLYGPENAGDTMAGEFVVLLCMCFYLLVGCLKKGIWDRHLQSTPKANIIYSILAAALTALFNAILAYRNYKNAAGALAVFVVYFLGLSIGLSVTLCLCSALYHRRRKRLEEENTDEENEDKKDNNHKR